MLPRELVCQPMFKKMKIVPKYSLLHLKSINKSAIVIDIVRCLYYRCYLYFNRLLQRNDLPTEHDNGKMGVDTYKTYSNLLNFVGERRNSSADVNNEIFELVLAFRTMNMTMINTNLAKKKHSNLIIASYLYLLRRYPGESCIELWSKYFARKKKPEFMLERIKEMAEFEKSGIFLYDKQEPV